METVTDNQLERNNLTVAELAVSQPGALEVFTRYNIDYCCGGHRSLDEACLRLGLQPEKIRKEIEASKSETTEAQRPETWSSSLLIDFIVQNHHAYVKKAIPELEAFLDKVCVAHGDDTVELLQIRQNFLDVAEELTSHMGKEELVLFPAIKKLEGQDKEDHPLKATIQFPISAMEKEHKLAGDLIKQIRRLSNNYAPPDFACPTFRITYQKLQDFDRDLMKHIHLENNILFERYKQPEIQSSCSLR